MDQIAAMRAFVRVVQTKSFSAVAREQQTTQATISKKVAALEDKLGVKLLTRSSRESSLTQIGESYYEKCLFILSELDEAEANARMELSTPKGILRITAPVPLGYFLLTPIIKEFTEQYPDIKVEVNYVDKHIDLVSEGIDLAIRASRLEDSSLIAQKLFDNPMLMVASPQYLERQGIPKTPKQLTHHNCIVYSLFKKHNVWSFQKDGEVQTVSVSGSVSSNSGLCNMQSALEGVGITPLPIWMVKEHLKQGTLIQVLSEYQADNIPFSVVYPQNRYIPLKVRSFIELLKKRLLVDL
ncbi:LysR family transcriptional regulator [Vibrio sp. TRT 17S01]|uniref:LysR family transcriptional regulator n=1 Tax=Vibrio sp. TRT 17S01 TaxID=3418505 RepID=UPI003CF1D583